MKTEKIRLMNERKVFPPTGSLWLECLQDAPFDIRGID
jgi:hypothetical protein